MLSRRWGKRLRSGLRAQALSKRIHYGKFVAEAKFRARPQEYARLIRQRDSDALMALLTDEAVEAKVHPLVIAESPLTRGILISNGMLFSWPGTRLSNACITNLHQHSCLVAAEAHS